MLNSFFSVVYGVLVMLLLWQAFRIMGRGFLTPSSLNHSKTKKKVDSMSDRTGRITIHPELLDGEGRITDEELLTVRFSEDLDPPQSAETSAE